MDASEDRCCWICLASDGELAHVCECRSRWAAWRDAKSCAAVFRQPLRPPGQQPIMGPHSRSAGSLPCTRLPAWAARSDCCRCCCVVPQAIALLSGSCIASAWHGKHGARRSQGTSCCGVAQTFPITLAPALLAIAQVAAAERRQEVSKGAYPRLLRLVHEWR